MIRFDEYGKQKLELEYFKIHHRVYCVRYGKFFWKMGVRNFRSSLND